MWARRCPGEIKLASLQLLGVPAKLFFPGLAFLNIETRSIPLDDVAVRNREVHTSVEHPAVFSIRAADPSFELRKLLQSRASSATCHQDPSTFLRVKRRSSIPGRPTSSRVTPRYSSQRSIEVVEVGRSGLYGVNQRRESVDET